MIEKIILDEVDESSKREGLYAKVMRGYLTEKFLNVLSFLGINDSVYNRPYDVCTLHPNVDTVVNTCSVNFESPYWLEGGTLINVKGDQSDFGSVYVCFSSDGLYIILRRRPFSPIPDLEQVFTSIEPNELGKTKLYLAWDDMESSTEIIEFLYTYIQYIFTKAPFNNRAKEYYNLILVNGDEVECQFGDEIGIETINVLNNVNSLICKLENVC
ncbi:hypothetical protein [Proteus mirabilis]|uniref:hypothetical protein n=1 Tax=Proteus mirabilis TaxID=584 RepID=UPI0034D5F1AF